MIEMIAMVEHAARRLSRGIADAGARDDGDGGLIRPFIRFDDADRLITGIDQLDRPDDDALIGVHANGAETGGARRILGERRQAIEIEAVAGERPDEIGAAVLALPRLQRIRMSDVLLLEMLVVFVGGAAEPAIGNEASYIKREIV